jgi:hypothetical protein
MITRNRTRIEPTRSRWRAYTLILTCTLLTVSGVFFAGRQHFSWMDYGMKNSRLRKQIDDLQAEKRRLLLAREISLSPMEIKKAAKKAGLADAESSATVAQVVTSTKDKAVPAAATTGTVSLASATAASKPMVTRTVAVTPAPQATAASYKKIDKSKLIARTAAE